jgi:large subunit ribosomal protein L25
MNIQKIEVIKRGKVGRGHCRRLRKSGRIPVIFYGKGRNESYSLAEPDFRSMDKTSGASLVELEPDEGEASLALVKEIQRDPCTDEVLHIDFIEVTRGQELQTKVPLVIIGEAEGVKVDGGILDVMAREVEVRCRPSLLPSGIEIDVSELTLGDSLHLSALPEIEGVTYIGDAELTLVSCVGTASGRAEAEEFEDGETDEEGETEGEEGEEDSGGDASNDSGKQE